MTVLKHDETAVQSIGAEAERRLAFTDNLMMVVIDFGGGPQDEPDPPHSHPHEQATYVAAGEVVLYMDSEEKRLGPGDVFLVPSGRPHCIRRLTEHVRLIDCFTPIREDFLE